MKKFNENNVAIVVMFINIVVLCFYILFHDRTHPTLHNNQAPTTTQEVEKAIEPDTTVDFEAGFDEKQVSIDSAYNAKDYDAFGFPKRGYLFSSEARAEHLTNMMDKQRFLKKYQEMKEKFIDSVAHIVLSTGNAGYGQSLSVQLDIPPSILIAQALVESRYGTSRLSVEGTNFHGMMWRDRKHKDRKGVAGKMLVSDKNIAGKTKQYNFVKYESPWWSAFYHAQTLNNGYRHRLLDADIPLRERWMAALCNCKDSRMLASDAKRNVKKGGYLYAGACAWKARDGKTSKYVATLRYIVRIHSLEKYDQLWEKHRKPRG